MGPNELLGNDENINRKQKYSTDEKNKKGVLNQKLKLHKINVNDRYNRVIRRLNYS